MKARRNGGDFLKVGQDHSKLRSPLRGKAVIKLGGKFKSTLGVSDGRIARFRRGLCLDFVLRRGLCLGFYLCRKADICRFLVTTTRNENNRCYNGQTKKIPHVRITRHARCQTWTIAEGPLEKRQPKA